MNDVDLKVLTRENDLYAYLIVRCLVNESYSLTTFGDDDYVILQVVEELYKEVKKKNDINFKRARIEVSINIATKDQDDKVYEISKIIKEDTGEFLIDEQL